MRVGIHAIILLTLCIVSSCSRGDSSERLIGEWWLIQADFDTPDLDSGFISAARHSLESSIFYFEQENRFEIEDTSSIGGSYQGTWEYSPEGKLILTYPNLPIDPEIFEVLKLSRKKLIIRQHMESVGILEYHLERRN